MATFRENKTTFNSIFISYAKLIDDMVVLKGPCQNNVKRFFYTSTWKRIQIIFIKLVKINHKNKRGNKIWDGLWWRDSFFISYT